MAAEEAQERRLRIIDTRVATRAAECILFTYQPITVPDLILLTAIQ